MIKFNNLFLTIAPIVLIVLLFGALIKWEIYKYNDCKKVGHSTIYCLFAKN